MLELYTKTTIEISRKVFIKPYEIVYLESELNYTRIFFQDSSSLLLSRTLSHVAEKLKGYPFFRVHRSHIVNLLHVNEYRHANQTLRLLNHKIVTISRRKQDIFMETYSHFISN